ncbi:hypothetical protein [Micromonospora thermarum]|uniref:hypothetical protein n=1 Tax=Micromonospora thermarum TaxID=2720024 RepID=UPI00197B8FF0|nr:hypothetical protein [Micromonospora thermarum]
MTTPDDLAGLLLREVSADRMAATVATLASDRMAGRPGLAAVGIGAGMGGYHSPADTPDRVHPATLTAVARLVVATAHLAGVAPARLSSPIGDRR